MIFTTSELLSKPTHTQRLTNVYLILMIYLSIAMDILIWRHIYLFSIKYWGSDIWGVEKLDDKHEIIIDTQQRIHKNRINYLYVYITYWWNFHVILKKKYTHTQNTLNTRINLKHLLWILHKGNSIETFISWISILNFKKTWILFLKPLFSQVNLH